LPSSIDPARDRTIQNALSGPHTLRVGLEWWTVGMVFAARHFIIVYRMFRGEVTLAATATGTELQFHSDSKAGLENPWPPRAIHQNFMFL
jgi:hypothetical protein